MLKDGFLVGTITVISTVLVTIQCKACKNTVTIGETISCGKASLAGGTKEKTSVVKCVGTIDTATRKENKKNTSDTLEKHSKGAEPYHAEDAVDAREPVSIDEKAKYFTDPITLENDKKEKKRNPNHKQQTR